MVTATSRATAIACVVYTRSQRTLILASTDGRYLKFAHTRIKEANSNTNTSSPQFMMKTTWKFFSVLRGAFRIQTRTNQMAKAASHRARKWPATRLLYCSPPPSRMTSSRLAFTNSTTVITSHYPSWLCSLAPSTNAAESTMPYVITATGSVTSRAKRSGKYSGPQLCPLRGAANKVVYTFSHYVAMQTLATL